MTVAERVALLIDAWGLDPQDEVCLFLSGSSLIIPPLPGGIIEEPLAPEIVFSGANPHETELVIAALRQVQDLLRKKGSRKERAAARIETILFRLERLKAETEEGE